MRGAVLRRKAEDKDPRQISPARYYLRTLKPDSIQPDFQEFRKILVPSRNNKMKQDEILGQKFQATLAPLNGNFARHIDSEESYLKSRMNHLRKNLTPYNP
ncbi:Caspase-10 [Dirofilaria immitis]